MTFSVWLKNRWWDFRVGDSTYLRYFIGFFQFAIIVYTLYIVQTPLAKFITDLTMFITIFFLIYVPSCILIGNKFHTKHQLSTDISIQTLQNPYVYKATPGKELALSLPLQKKQLELLIRFYKQFPFFTHEDEEELRAHLRMVESLMRGESIGA